MWEGCVCMCVFSVYASEDSEVVGSESKNLSVNV